MTELEAKVMEATNHDPVRFWVLAAGRAQCVRTRACAHSI
jgi:hypothetical protein